MDIYIDRLYRDLELLGDVYRTATLSLLTARYKDTTSVLGARVILSPGQSKTAKATTVFESDLLQAYRETRALRANGWAPIVDEVTKGRLNIGDVSAALTRDTSRQQLGTHYYPFSKRNVFDNPSGQAKLSVDGASRYQLYSGEPKFPDLDDDVPPTKHDKEDRPRPRTPASVNRDLACLSKILSMAFDNELIDSNPMRRVRMLKESPSRERFITAEEEKKLFAQLTGRREHIRSVVTIALNTGMRRGEILGWHWEHVNFLARIIFIAKSKTG